MASADSRTFSHPVAQSPRAGGPRLKAPRYGNLMKQILCLLLLVSTTASAQQREEPLWPGAKYDPAIPTLRQVVGHDPGQEITSPDQIGAYLQALTKAAPTRTRLFEYARTWEDRPLWLMVIGSPERMAKLDQVKADAKRLADPRNLSNADADRL